MATVGHPDAIRRITVHYVNPPPVAASAGTGEDNFDGLHNDLQDQESLYQSILDGAYYSNSMRGTRTCHCHGESSSGSATAATSDVDEQIALDMAYARQLQEMDDLTIQTPPNEDDDISCVASPSDSENDEPTHVNNEEEDNNDDPDNMTYEQMQALVESVGNEDRGLPDELISYLVPWKYKSGFFSRKTHHEDCTICLSTFSNRERLITLPCKHNYHSVCIVKWLKIDKTCPVCKYEVFGPA